jgi:hypothetical protein
MRLLFTEACLAEVHFLQCSPTEARVLWRQDPIALLPSWCTVQAEIRHAAAATFADLLAQLCDLCGLRPDALTIFVSKDEETGLKAFNRDNALFFNLRFFNPNDYGRYYEWFMVRGPRVRLALL